MNFLKKIFRSVTYKDWYIGFPENTLEEIVNRKPLRVQWLKTYYKDRSFADPFILDVDENNIYVLVEEILYMTGRGRISKLTVDKKTYELKDSTVVLDLSTHLSFPKIIRKKGKIYLMPENSESGKWSMYEYNVEHNTVKIIYEINEPLTDTVITEVFGENFLFTTKEPDSNGFNLYLYSWDEDNQTYKEEQIFTFDENSARMGGDFFEVDGQIYRPAQESNEIYGHAIIIQEVIYKDYKWEFKEVCRLYSTHPKYNIALHTFNSYKGVQVIDVKGLRHPYLGRLFETIRRLF